MVELSQLISRSTNPPYGEIKECGGSTSLLYLVIYEGERSMNSWVEWNVFLMSHLNLFDSRNLTVF